VDVPSPVDGHVSELLADPGEMVPVGTVIITFDVEGEVPDEDPVEVIPADGESDPGGESVDGEGRVEGDGSATRAASDADGERAAGSASTDRVFAAPSTRNLARELGVDLAAVAGSTPGGRVTDADVRAAADGASGSGSHDRPSVTGATGASDEPAGRERTLATPATRGVAGELGVDVDDVPAVEERDGEAFVTEAAVREYAEAQRRARAAEREAGASEAGGRERETREPYRGVRRTVGEAMERAKFTAPHVTHHDTADVTALVEVRERLADRAADRDVGLTYLPFVMKAVVAALREHPVLNTSLDEDSGEIVYKHYYNLGVAVATDAGLLVPVVRRVDDKGLLEVARETDRLVERARGRSIDREEMQGGTFTITNFGAVGGEYATPIINYPETAILGLGEIKKRPAVRDGEVVPGDVMTLSLSIDHRVVDGAEAAAFVNTLKEYLETPELLLLE
jgi:pyruvate dehydrogenase E2 component (dihydrolipoamide acetyltransferase)